MEVLPQKRFWGNGHKRGALTLETCPSNLVVVVAHLTNVTNLRKIGQKCGRYRRRKVCADTHTYPQVMLYLSSAMNCIGQTSKYLTGMCLVCCLWRVVSNRPRRHARPRWPTLHRPYFCVMFLSHNISHHPSSEHIGRGRRILSATNTGRPSTAC